MVPRSAGVLIPLFSLRTRGDLGRGEIPQLIPMIDFALRMGHRMIQLLPLDETAPTEPSPYSALSVLAIDPLYISVGELTGRFRLRRARLRIRPGRVVPRMRYVRAKRELLARAFEAFAARGPAEQRRALEEFKEDNSYWLNDYSLFRALKERFQFQSWEHWPEELVRRDPAALSSARRELAHSIAKYCYFQFLAHRQWIAVREYASKRGALIGGDLAFSPTRDSAEVWAHQSLFDRGRTVGAPPDAFSDTGQRWELATPDWPRHRAQGFQLWRSRVRRAWDLYDILRVDHVVGLYRTFSFGAKPDEPGKFFPESESEQRAQGEEIMRAIKQEARGMTIVAEDLGVVPGWVRESLTRLGIPGYKVMRWEREEDTERYLSPAKYPELAVATTGTHDTEPLALWWRNQPPGERKKLLSALGLNATVDRHARLLPATLDAVLEALYGTPAVLTVLPIQDLFGWNVRINRPATVNESNWTYRLPLALEQMMESPPIVRRLESLRAIAIRSGRFNA